ncbi:MAG: C1 family peptidase [Thermoguttaceae bacterium]|jgi:C1A family cysteine protease|nr:C1 family peptidase [Thermoguttaceae bacterium]
MSHFFPEGLGWLPDLPDPRDLTPESEPIAAALGQLRSADPMPRGVDWREYAAPIDRQTAFSSAAQACANLLTYFERRASGRLFLPSPQFLHWTGARMSKSASGAGAWQIRTVLRAVARLGVPDEPRGHSVAASLAEAPDAFAFASARRFPSLKYVRLDGRDKRPDAVLRTIKAFLAAGFASVFGFTVFSSLGGESEIPYPTIYDGVQGGIAAVALGYDDTRRIRSCRGAILAMLPWGTDWGEAGFGWLPYLYITQRVALDFWTLVDAEWLASGEFSCPRT